MVPRIEQLQVGPTASHDGPQPAPVLAIGVLDIPISVDLLLLVQDDSIGIEAAENIEDLGVREIVRATAR